MTTQIDVRAILSRTGQLHRDLLTRPTGRAVRTSIEAELAAAQAADVVILDFSGIRLIDFSCADEILAQLVRLAPCVVLVRGLSEFHAEPVLQVLERQHLAVVVEHDGSLSLMGEVGSSSRTAFGALAARRGTATAPEELARELAWPMDDVTAALDDLAGRRLVIHGAGRYHLPSAVA